MKRIITSLTAFSMLFLTLAIVNPAFADEQPVDTSVITTDALTTQDVIDLVDALFVTDFKNGVVGESIELGTTFEEYLNAYAAVETLDDSVVEKQGLIDKLDAAQDHFVALALADAMFDETRTGLDLDNEELIETIFATYLAASELPNSLFKEAILQDQALAFHYYEVYQLVSIFLDDNGNAVYQFEADDEAYLLDKMEFELVVSQVEDMQDGPFKTLLMDIANTAAAERNAYTYTVTSAFPIFTGKGQLSATIDAPTNAILDVEVRDAEGNLVEVGLSILAGKSFVTLNGDDLALLADGTYTLNIDYVDHGIISTTYKIDRNFTPDPDPIDDNDTDPTTPDPKPDPDSKDEGTTKDDSDKPKDTLPATGMSSNNSALIVSSILVATGAVFTVIRKREHN